MTRANVFKKLACSAINEILLRKSREFFANVTPASPMDTWTAERTFARGLVKSRFSENRTLHISVFVLLAYTVYHYSTLRGYPFRRPCIHG